ncbi:uncharacterized protein SAPINGB_P005507 [Magnusiomyces paraingens]|uniref:Transcription activator GCR1-like domain-containing protein n=1 Tax=Magnusiomyces paraingens TaxID=2606893 RepID=A0A5E8C765_9ASCO|nr:uncharacterized protein SAPINGB_P005507 [Saprochaete ingens]VVT57046.1 unnamed protein product [Saprochaete ingens]
MTTRFVPINSMGPYPVDKKPRLLKEKNELEMSSEDHSSIVSGQQRVRPDSPDNNEDDDHCDFINYSPQDLSLMIRWSLAQSLNGPSYIRSISVMTLSQALFLEPALANYLDLTDLRVLRGEENPLQVAKSLLVTVSNQKSPRLYPKPTKQGPWYTGSIRHMDPLVCPHFWLAASLVERFHLHGADPQLALSEASPEFFSSIKLFHDYSGSHSKDNPTEPFSWESQINDMAKMREGSGCNWFRPIKDAPRAAGLVFALENGAVSSNILRLSSWGEQDFEGVDICRSVKEIPSSVVACAAGAKSNGHTLEYRMVRDRCDPSLELKSLLFPFINEELIFGTGPRSSLEDKSKMEFDDLRRVTFVVLDYLREVFLQDFIFVADRLGPIFYQLPIANLPIFKTKAYRQFLTLQKNVFNIKTESMPPEYQEQENVELVDSPNRLGKRSGLDHGSREALKSKRAKTSSSSESRKSSTQKGSEEKRERKRNSIDLPEISSDLDLFSLNTRKPSPELSMDVENLSENEKPLRKKKRTKIKKTGGSKKQAHEKGLEEDSVDLSVQKQIVFDISSSSERELSLPPPVSLLRNKIPRKQKVAQPEQISQPRMTRARAQQQHQQQQQQLQQHVQNELPEKQSQGAFEIEENELKLPEDSIVSDGGKLVKKNDPEINSLGALEDSNVGEVAATQQIAPESPEYETNDNTIKPIITGDSQAKTAVEESLLEKTTIANTSGFKQTVPKSAENVTAAETATTKLAFKAISFENPKNSVSENLAEQNAPEIPVEPVVSNNPAETISSERNSKPLVIPKSEKTTVENHSVKKYGTKKQVDRTAFSHEIPAETNTSKNPSMAIVSESSSKPRTPVVPLMSKALVDNAESSPEENSPGSNMEPPSDLISDEEASETSAPRSSGSKTPKSSALENLADSPTVETPTQTHPQKPTRKPIRKPLPKPPKPSKTTENDATSEECTAARETIVEESDTGPVTMEALMAELQHMRTEFTGTNNNLRAELAQARRDITSLKKEVHNVRLLLGRPQSIHGARNGPASSELTRVTRSITSGASFNNNDEAPVLTEEDGVEDNNELITSASNVFHAMAPMVPMVEETVEVKSNSNSPYDNEFTFLHSPGSFEEIWEEFTKPSRSGKLSAMDMEAKYGTRWRRNMAVKRTFRRRRNVYDAIYCGLKRGLELEECFLILEQARLEAKMSMSIFISKRENFPEELKVDENEN